MHVKSFPILFSFEFLPEMVKILLGEKESKGMI